MRRFWMVYRANGGAPTMQHGSRGEAEGEAERLARRSPGDTFFVLESVAAVKKVDVTWARFDQSMDDDIPF